MPRMAAAEKMALNDCIGRKIFERKDGSKYEAEELLRNSFYSPFKNLSRVNLIVSPLLTLGPCSLKLFYTKAASRHTRVQ
jgi:hypothetical protein